MDVTCLWCHVQPLLKNELSSEYMDKIDSYWSNGCLVDNNMGKKEGSSVFAHI